MSMLDDSIYAALSILEDKVKSFKSVYVKTLVEDIISLKDIRVKYELINDTVVSMHFIIDQKSIKGKKRLLTQELDKYNYDVEYIKINDIDLEVNIVKREDK